MSTNDNISFSKNQSFSNVNSQIDNKNQYSNFNLNQNQKYLNFSPIKSKSKSNNNKFFETLFLRFNGRESPKRVIIGLQKKLKLADSKVSEISDFYEEKEKLQTWNKSSNISNFSTLKDKTDKYWKKNDLSNSNNNSSTLSLHISAYENSLESELNEFCIKNDQILTEIRENTTSFDAPTFLIQNPFEFPRQQNEKMSEPEVLQYKASQHLFNPNKAPVYNQKSGKPVAARIVQKRFASSLNGNRIGAVFGAFAMSSVLLQKKPAAGAMLRVLKPHSRQIMPIRYAGHGHGHHHQEDENIERKPETYRPGSDSYAYENPWPKLNGGRFDWLFQDGWRRPLAKDQGAKTRREWLWFGQIAHDEHGDWFRHHYMSFFAFTCMTMWITWWIVVLRPDWPQGNEWALREAHLEIIRRKKAGLPLISKDLVDPQRAALSLPSEEELRDFEILI